MLKKWFGNRAFYKRILFLALPIVLHQGITNFVSLLDNIMVGQLNQNAIAGVAAANQLMFIFNIVIVGCFAGAGIFVAQYHGANDAEGVKQAFRTKVLYGFGLLLFFEAIFYFCERPLLSMFLTEAASMQEAVTYLNWMLLAIPFIIIAQLYGVTLREIGQTKIPMYAGLAAVVVNCSLNYVLIFGKLGAPALGVGGAAIATVVSRVVEAAIVVFLSHAKKYEFATHAYTQFHISKTLLKRSIRKTIPTALNDFLWAVGSTLIIAAYAKLGEDVVSALSISQAVTNIFYIMFSALATSISIVVGGELGANHLEEAKSNSTKLVVLGVLIALTSGLIIAVTSRWIPLIYNVSAETRNIASHLLLISGIFFVCYTYNACCFFILRAGGAAKQVLILDSVFMWVAQVTISVALVTFTKLDIYVIYTLVQGTDLIKMGLATYMWKRGDWLQNLAYKIED